MRQTMTIARGWAVIWLIALLLPIMDRPLPAQAVEFDDQVKKPVAESIRVRQATQKQEEQWRDERQQLTAHYEQLEMRQSQLEKRQKELVDKNNAAQQRIADKQQQLADIEDMQAGVLPLIEDQLQALGQHLNADLPYLMDERRARLERLNQVYDDPEVTVSEKFRKVMEALLIEAEYGNTIEVYQQTIAVGGRERLVQILRLGRIALYYQTLDQKSCGFFNIKSTSWQPLPTSCNRSLQAAMDIGAKRRPVEMLVLPLGRMRVQ